MALAAYRQRDYGPDIGPAQALLFQIEPFAAAPIAQALQSAGYWIAVAASMDQALGRLGAPDADFKALVAADLADGPPASVRRLLKAARRRFPSIEIVCVGERPARCGISDIRTCDYSADALMRLMRELHASLARG